MLRKRKTKKRRHWRKRRHIPPLTEAQILAWADAFHEETGRWPKSKDGRIQGTLGDETWNAMHYALIQGHRGLPGGSSLPRLLEARRGVRNKANLPPLSVNRILSWADAHHRSIGRWPNLRSGSISGTNGESWFNVENALRRGERGLAGGTSLAQLLDEHRQVRNKSRLPSLSITKIRAWARAHRRRTGRFPGVKSGPISEAPGETWTAIECALGAGLRGLPGGSSLARILGRPGPRRRRPKPPPLRTKQILEWADAHFQRTGRWPGARAGPIPDVPGETWNAVASALYEGLRSLRTKCTLRSFLRRHRRGRTTARSRNRK